MTDYHWALQQALYSALKAADVANDRVYDAVPQDVVFPYVQIGEAQVVPDDVSTSAGSGDDGVSEFLTLHVWSRYRGQKEAKQIMSAIYDALHGQSLTVTGRASALAWVRNTRLFLDPDGLTRHGVMDVEIIHRS